MTAAEFRLLGDVEVRQGIRPVDVGPSRQRGILTVLLIEANRFVLADRLVDRVWGQGRRPDRPTNTVHTYVSLLRKALTAVDGVAIERGSAGYRLTVDECGVDLHRFRVLAGRARAADDDDSAARLFEDALRLWRGEPFAGLDTTWFGAVRAALNEQRQAARLDLTDLLLRRGHHAGLVAELADQADEHPFDERLAGQLMVALYGSGRPADALERYRRLRRRLADEQGTDPCRALQELHQRILAADPALVAGLVGPPRRSAAPVVPRQLPAPPRLFTGRADELARLTKTMDRHGQTDGSTVVSVVGGPGGVGKTWLALHWAHQHLDRFPDGQLYAELRGFDPAVSPTPPAVVLGRFLSALGVGPTAIPTDLDARAGLYRSLVADRHLLIVLDDAAGSDQVTPLLPGSRTCTVLVTSRRHLAGLATAHGARSLDLDVLSDVEAWEVLAGHLGRDRLAAEPRVVRELLTHCAGLPLALGIAAVRVASRPGLPLAALARELRDDAGRLTALETGDSGASLLAVLSASWRALSGDAAAVLGLLGLVPCHDIDLRAVVALTALSPAKVRMILRELEDVRLVQQRTPGRYRLHDLVRLYAAARAERDHSEAARTAALRRLVGFHLDTVSASTRSIQESPKNRQSPARHSDRCFRSADGLRNSVVSVGLDGREVNGMALLDLQGLEPAAVDGGAEIDVSTLTVLLCTTKLSSLSVAYC